VDENAVTEITARVFGHEDNNILIMDCTFWCEFKGANKNKDGEAVGMIVRRILK